MKIATCNALILLALCPLLTQAMFDWGKKLSGKVDCGVSAWSDWKCSGSTCGRTRAVLLEPRNGGQACPPLQETKASNSKESPWDQNKGKVTTKIQSKFVVGSGRVLSFAKTESKGPTKVLQSRDLMFLLDMSGSIKKSEFRKTKQKMGELIAEICGQIGKTRQHNRIAVITFSKSVALNFDFKSHYDLKGVKDAIMKIPQERSLTCTGDAFKFASTYMFDPKSGVRDATESVKEVLVLTDGRSNCGANLAVEVKKLQVKAFVFALAIGRFSSKGKAEIESMVSRPLIDHIFSLANFQNFFDVVDAIKTFPGKCVPFELSR